MNNFSNFLTEKSMLTRDVSEFGAVKIVKVSIRGVTVPTFNINVKSKEIASEYMLAFLGD